MTDVAEVHDALRKAGETIRAQYLELGEARAQIAAKDAALRVMRVYVQRAVNQFYNTEAAQEDLAAIDAALAAPARGTGHE